MSGARAALLALGLSVGALALACSTSAPADAGPCGPACSGGKQPECARAASQLRGA